MSPGRSVPENLAAEISSGPENSDSDGRFCWDPREALRWEDCAGRHHGEK